MESRTIKKEQETTVNSKKLFTIIPQIQGQIGHQQRKQNGETTYNHTPATRANRPSTTKTKWG